MGRPKIYDEPRVATAFEQPASVHDYLQRTASARDASVNLLVTDAVFDYLHHLAGREDRSTNAGSARVGRLITGRGGAS